MNLKSVSRGLIQRWGPTTIKRGLWNKEYSEGRWAHCEYTPTDPVYGFILKHCRNGSILDLGCGAGNTGTELPKDAYREYTGVDVSDVAIAKAVDRSTARGRTSKNKYLHSDILTYSPIQQYDVILFRESMFYVPRTRIRSTLERYSAYLTDGGLFIATFWDRHACRHIIEEISTGYEIIDSYENPSGGTGLAFRRHSTTGDAG